MNTTRAMEQIREREQEQKGEQAKLSPGQETAGARRSAVSAFVHALQNESGFREMPGGIGQEVSAFAREFNNSLRARIRG